MPNAKRRTPSADPNALISTTLKAGVSLSFVLLLAGIVWTALIPAAPGQPAIARDAATGVIHWNVVLLLAGLLVLMATPVLRIVTALWYFTKAGERRYA